MPRPTLFYFYWKPISLRTEIGEIPSFSPLADARIEVVFAALDVRTEKNPYSNMPVNAFFGANQAVFLGEMSGFKVLRIYWKNRLEDGCVSVHCWEWHLEKVSVSWSVSRSRVTTSTGTWTSLSSHRERSPVVHGYHGQVLHFCSNNVVQPSSPSQVSTTI